MWVTVRKAIKSDPGDPFPSEFLCSRTLPAAETQTESHVIEHCFPRQQCVLLEHIGGPPVQAQKAASVNFHGSVRWRYESRSKIQKCGFAASARAHHGQKHSFGDIERHALDGGVPRSTRRCERLRDSFDMDSCRAVRTSHALLPGIPNLH